MVQLRDKTTLPGRYREAADVDCTPLEVAKFAHEQHFDPNLPPACFPSLAFDQFPPVKIMERGYVDLEDDLENMQSVPNQEVIDGTQARIRHYLASVKLDEGEVFAKLTTSGTDEDRWIPRVCCSLASFAYLLKL